MNSKRKAFTTIELLVAMAIFSALITIASGAFIRALRSQQTATNISEVNDNVNIVLDRIARDIKSGSGFLWDAATRDLKLVNAAGQTVHYRLTDSGLEFGIENESGEIIYTPLTAENIRITGFDINVTGVPPRLTVNISASGFGRELENISTNIQTTVSTRGAAEGLAVSAEEVVVPPPLDPTVFISASPTTISSGQSATITWSSSNTTSCSAPWTSKTSVSGNESVSPTETTTYQITCAGDNGSVSGSVTINVSVQPPNLLLTANPTAVNLGSNTSLTWSATDATNCVADGGWAGDKALSGNESVGPINSQTIFGLTCTGSGGSINRSVTVSILTETPTVKVGPRSSVFIGSDGLPLIAYFISSLDGLDLGLRVAKCSDLSCDNFSTTTLIFGRSLLVPYFIKILPNTNGLPLIFAASYDTIKVFKCNNVSCSSNESSIMPITRGSVYFDVDIGSNGLPIILLYASNPSGSRYPQRTDIVTCGNSLCNSGNTSSTVLNLAAAGLLSIGSDDVPAFVYSVTTLVSDPFVGQRPIGKVYFAKCRDIACSQGLITNAQYLTEGESLGISAFNNSVIPTILYSQIGSPQTFTRPLKLLTWTPGSNPLITNVLSTGAGAAAMTRSASFIVNSGGANGQLRGMGRSGIPITTIDNGGTYPSVTDGPFVSYFSEIDKSIRFVRCGDSTCSSNNTIRTIDR